MKKQQVYLTLLICLFATTQATVIFNDGQIHDVDYVVQGTVDVYNDASSGDYTTVNFLPNAQLGWDFHAYDNSRVNISGGLMTQTFYSFDHSQVTFSEGTIGAICACDNSIVNVSGGSIAANLRADDTAQIIFSGGLIGNDIIAGELSFDSSTITFVGSNFTINGESVAYGQYFLADYESGYLSGMLNNGDIIGNDFHIVGDSSIILIPEPTTLLLLGVGGLLIRKRK